MKGNTACLQCGAVLPPGQLQCTSCGRPADAGGSPPPPAKGSKPTPRRDKSRDRELLGTIIADKYRVLDVLGQGGFGTVYLVEITAGMVGEKLALKILPEELGAQPAFREQFLNEIRVAMRLVDKHIVQIRDVGATQDGILYYTMDLCPGTTLAQVLRSEGKLPVARALIIVLNVLRGLMTAHAAGIVHRDLKPGNIMIDSPGGKDVVRVLDFGIATAVRRGERQRGAVGSPHYMPPEQFIGETVGFYSDLYSIGVILYECITGQRPHTGSTPQEVLKSLKTQTPPAAETLTPEVASFPGLAELMQKAIERNPERRFQSARELFDALNTILQRGTSVAVPTPAAPSPALPATERRTASPAPVRISAEHVRRRRQARRSPGSNAAAVAVGAILIVLVVAGVMHHKDIAAWLKSSQPPARVAKQGEPTPTPEARAPASKTAGPEAETRDAQPVTLEEKKAAAQATLAKRVDKLLGEASAAVERGDWPVAAERCETVLGLDAANAQAAQLLGLAQLRRGDPRKALETLQGASKLLESGGAATTPALDARIAEAMLAVEPPQTEAAAKMIERLRQAAPRDAELLVLQLRALEAQGKTTELQKTLAAARQLKIESSDLQAFEARLQEGARQNRKAQAQALGAEALIALEQGDWQRAAELGKQAFELAPGAGPAATQALAHAAAGQLEAARKALPQGGEPIAGKDEDEGRRLADVRTLLTGLEASAALAARPERQEIKAAEELLDMAVASSDPLVQALAQMHGARLTQRWSADSEVDARRKAGAASRPRLQAALKQSSFPATLRPEALYLLGLLQLDQGDLERSDAAYRQALTSFAAAEKAGFKTAELYEGWARTYDRVGNLIRAASLYRTAYERRPSAASCLRAASYYLEANPSSSEALEILEDGRRRFKDSVEIRRKYEELNRS